MVITMGRPVVLILILIIKHGTNATLLKIERFLIKMKVNINSLWQKKIVVYIVLGKFLEVKSKHMLKKCMQQVIIVSNVLML